MTEPEAPPSTNDHGRILIVDDNPTNLDVLFDFLSNQGYDILVAEDGVSALERAEYAKPELILLDIMMPRMNGLETCERLKADPLLREIPVIFMTALDSLEDKMRGFRCGGVDYITKPFQNEEVLARVRSHLAIQRMKRDLVERNEQLAMQNEALDAYARTVAHDLKNPLNLIMNFSRLIRDEGDLQGTPAADLDLVIKSSERMNHIIQDLLLLAQMRNDEVNPVRINMQSVVSHSLERLATDLQEANAEITAPADWPDVMGHASWVQAVWVNYISNALKYGGDAPKIELLALPDEETTDFCCFAVRDRGAGVPPELHHSIFEEFSRVGGEEAEGHGIGLSIVRRIIHKLGGRVGVMNNEDGKGSTFFFTLPRDQG
jgi:signal transduction histidine kinase